MYNIYKASVSTSSVQQILPHLLQLTLQEQSRHVNGLRLTTAKFKTLIFSVLGFALPCIADIWIFMILHDFCLLPA
jgi:hypothetical protein